MGSVSGDSGHGSSHTDAYDELFQTPSIADLDPLDNDQEETGNKVGFCSCSVKREFRKMRVDTCICAFLVFQCVA